MTTTTEIVKVDSHGIKDHGIMTKIMITPEFEMVQYLWAEVIEQFDQTCESWMTYSYNFKQGKIIQ